MNSQIFEKAWTWINGKQDEAPLNQTMSSIMRLDNANELFVKHWLIYPDNITEYLSINHTEEQRTSSPLARNSKNMNSLPLGM
jgi:hypothetical protein